MDLGQRNKVSVQGNMSSMTDLVFLLLIFFILLSTQIVNGEEVNLPQTSGTPREGSQVTLTITPDLRYQVNKEEMDKEHVKTRIEALFTNVPEEDQRIILNVDRDVPTGETIEMLGMAKENKWEVVVATKNKKK